MHAVRGALAASALILAFSDTAFAQPADADDVRQTAFNGDCSDPTSATPTTLPLPSPSERLRSAAGGEGSEPVKSGRVFAEIAPQRSAGDSDAAYFACHSRLDGIWREQSRVTFDTSAQPKGWAAENPTLAAFAHGDYTTPDLFVIETHGDTLRQLTVHDVWNDGPGVLFESVDDVTVAAVLQQAQASKTWIAKSVGNAQRRLTLSLTRSGLLRLSLDGKDFYRPDAGTAKAERDSQSPVTDPFLLGYNPKNLRASRQGYDPVTQNPDAFMQNGGKLDVFERASPQDYQVNEQLTVPAGLSLVEEGGQAYVYYSTLIASERDSQEASRSSFGVKAEVRQASRGVGAGGSLGYTHARSEISGMKTSRSISQINAYQRYKKYALVRDMAFSRLSREFFDAVMDVHASRDANGGHDFTRLFNAFGTHYPYAVTYGAAGKLTTLLTEDSLTRNYESFTSDSGSASLSVNQGTVSGNISSSLRNRQGNTSTTGLGQTTFTAVGGNGSWNESGFSAGDTPYPILMDLRPISELLNPINFPNDPEIYTAMRAALRDAIVEYEAPFAQQLSADSALTSFMPEQTWQIEVLNTACYNRGNSENDDTVELSGRLNYDTRANPRGAHVVSYAPILDASDQRPVSMVCRWNDPTAIVIGKLIDVRGTVEQLRAVQAGFSVDMRELDYAGFVNPDDRVGGASPGFTIPAGNFPVGGESDLQRWQLPNDVDMKIVLHYKLKRIR